MNLPVAHTGVVPAHTPRCKQLFAGAVTSSSARKSQSSSLPLQVSGPVGVHIGNDPSGFVEDPSVSASWPSPLSVPPSSIGFGPMPVSGKPESRRDEPEPAPEPLHFASRQSGETLHAATSDMQATPRIPSTYSLRRVLEALRTPPLSAAGLEALPRRRRRRRSATRQPKPRPNIASRGSAPAGALGPGTLHEQPPPPLDANSRFAFGVPLPVEPATSEPEPPAPLLRITHSP
jgi:hypothetical protein